MYIYRVRFESGLEIIVANVTDEDEARKVALASISLVDRQKNGHIATAERLSV